MSETVSDIVKLSELLGEMGNIKRATDLPNGESEPDSHHSFSLALIAYHVATTKCSELDAHKVMLFALAHDLLEIITGDEDTQHYTLEQHADKQRREAEAMGIFRETFAHYPELLDAVDEYEKLDTPEAATVFVLDKACTTWTWLHHPNVQSHAKKRNTDTKADIQAWGERQRQKFAERLKVYPPQPILDIFEESFTALKGIFDE